MLSHFIPLKNDIVNKLVIINIFIIFNLYLKFKILKTLLILYYNI